MEPLISRRVPFLSSYRRPLLADAAGDQAVLSERQFTLGSKRPQARSLPQVFRGESLQNVRPDGHLREDVKTCDGLPRLILMFRPYKPRVRSDITSFRALRSQSISSEQRCGRWTPSAAFKLETIQKQSVS